jgi:hypothetical protein
MASKRRRTTRAASHKAHTERTGAGRRTRRGAPALPPVIAALLSHLMHPVILELSRRIQAGEALPAGDYETPLTVGWSASRQERLVAWLNPPDLAKLADTLRTDPKHLIHPAVFEQLMHLHRLAATPDAGGRLEGCVNE